MVKIFLPLLVINFVSASQIGTKSTIPVDPNTGVLSSTNVHTSLGLNKDIKKTLAGLKSKGSLLQQKVEEGGLKSESNSSGENSIPAISSNSFESFPEKDPLIRSKTKGLTYNSYCRPLTPEVLASPEKIQQTEIADGQLEWKELQVLGNSFFLRRGISSLYTDDFCNAYLPSQVEFIAAYKKHIDHYLVAPQTVKDDGSGTPTIKKPAKDSAAPKLTLHPTQGVYYDNLCNMYLTQTDKEVFEDLSKQLLIARSTSGGKITETRESLRGTSLYKVRDTDYWIDADTCELLTDDEVALYPSPAFTSEKVKRIRALLGI